MGCVVWYNGVMKENNASPSFHIMHTMSGDQIFTGSLLECLDRFQEIVNCQGPRADLHWYILGPRGIVNLPSYHGVGDIGRELA
jgi:hypothetical protein